MLTLKKNKFFLLGILILVIGFIFTLQIRKDKLNAPMSGDLEWITAHTLITLELWDTEGGPSQFNFSPIYTYPGRGNIYHSPFGGVMEKSGRHYYTSYPPFAFIFAYYSTKMLGGPDLLSIRTVNLIIHFLCALLLYLIIYKLRKNAKDTFSIAATTAVLLYLFSVGYLWGHSILYFADTLMQLLVLISIYLLIKLVKGQYKSQRMILALIGMATFISVYTEWLGLLFAFFYGITLLVFYFKEKKKVFLYSFWVIGITAILSLGLTVFQYSSLAGFETLVDVSQMKYQERSGLQEFNTQVVVYNWNNPRSWFLLDHFLNRNFSMVINLLGISGFFLIPVLIWRKSRKQIKNLKWKIIIPLILVLSVFCHYLILFNFNAIHNFANLKTALAMIIIIAVIIQIVEESINWKLNIAFSAILLFLLITRIDRSIRRYQALYDETVFPNQLDKTASLIKEYGDPDKYVFSNVFVNPEFIYKSKHLIFPMQDTSGIYGVMDMFQFDKAQYFYHNDTGGQYMIELVKQNDHMIPIKRMDF
ncbi:hypothetical protein K6119_08970 [Paracrocinitomix mangrovi]|uniref:hypothetical protein n=1 Tax=Paracrocinitomix mangrovi TaxID=2862509 RepID=UPI001C8DEEE3|nr:hypothetical protein [Paracrocinitomix mangrovi]UKN03643.1 hypothetical protein K6119_08970 [Paracrocinitomix mangrovi]